MSENTLKVIVLLMIVGAVVGLITGYAVAPRGEDTTALDNRITKLP